MFTGLIQEQGRISRIVKQQHSIKLTCKASRKLLADYKIGDSMSEHRSMYSYVRLSIDRCTATTLSIDRCTATYV